jgi:6,7-dimethyl-8-ribityllumazine synthase
MADRYALAVARFYEDLADKLVEGATRVLREAGAEVDEHDVPGAFELPLAAKYCAESGRYHGVVCLGAVIRGETAHFDHVAGQAASGIRAAAAETDVPVIFGVLTTETFEQAIDRAGGKHGNKGWDAAMAAMETASVLERLPKEAGG